MTITTVSTSAALVSALKVAHAGDTIQLAAGTYNSVSLENFHFATDVTITSLDPNHAAAMNNLQVKGVNGLTFQNLDFTVSGVSSTNAVTVESSQDVHFDDVHVHGTLNNNTGDDGGGILLRGSTDVSVTNSDFQQLKFGVAHVDSNKVVIAGSDFHDLRMDGVRGGGSSYVTISGNQFRDFHPDGDDHPDAIQFWTKGTKAAAHDILVENNIVQRGDGAITQGIFVHDESQVLPFEHVTIRGNLISGAMYNGIVVLGGKGVTIGDNLVQGFSDMKSWIQVSRADGVVLTDNTANMVTITDTVSHVTNTGSQIIAQATDGGAAVVAAWVLEHFGQSGGLNLVGGSGDDTLLGGALADTLSGGAGHDLLVGGAGNDIYAVGSDSKIVELASGGIDTVQRSGSYALPNYVENLELIGTKVGNATGNNLDNEITGNGATNVLTGGSGADTLDGGAGGDTMNGGVGADRLIGGAGADLFTFRAGDGKDVITDFGAGGEHDAIDISAMLAGGAHAVLTDGSSGVTITFTGGNALVADVGAGGGADGMPSNPTLDATAANSDSIFLQGVHLNQLHATSTGWVF